MPRDRRTLGFSTKQPFEIPGPRTPRSGAEHDVRCWPSAGFIPNETKVKRTDRFRNGEWFFDGTWKPSPFSMPPWEDNVTKTLSWAPESSVVAPKAATDATATHPALWSIDNV